MVSRDTAVHVAVLVLAVASLAVLNQVFPDGDSVLGRTATFVVFNGLVLASAHLLLALRGEDGIVPVAARWRFVGAVGVVLTLGSAAILFDPVSLGPVSSNTVLTVLAGSTIIGYLLWEVVAGYGESTSQTT